MICAVLFDLDGTLHDRDAAIRRMAEEQFEAFQGELRVLKHEFVDHLLKLDGTCTIAVHTCTMYLLKSLVSTVI
jgi:FMN phosphatase YigB (HAD superfamily)